MTPTSRTDIDDGHLRAVWQDILQTGIRRASHDVKDALNGVSVNLEVIRSRAQKPEAPASAVAQFAEGAASQLENLTTLIDAILALSRPERVTVDLESTVRRLAVLFSASTKASDRKLVVDTSRLAGSATTNANPLIARILIASIFNGIVMLSGGVGESIACVLASIDDYITLRIALAIPTDGLREIGEQYGILLANTTDGVTLQFPRA